MQTFTYTQRSPTEDLQHSNMVLLLYMHHYMNSHPPVHTASFKLGLCKTHMHHDYKLSRGCKSSMCTVVLEAD